MKVKKFIYISSIKVLGEKSTLNKPFNSESVPNPIGNYSLSKFLAEEKLANVYDDGLGGVKVKLVQPGARTELSYVTS